MKRWLFLTLAFYLLLVPQSHARALVLSYLERPPYYYTDESGHAAGLLVERTRRLLLAADIQPQFITLKPNQILFILKHAATPHCSIGWFKNPQRELFAKFTRPFYRNRPPVLLFRKNDRKRFLEASTLRQVFSNRELKLARIGTFSYGEQIDQLLEDLNPTSIFRSQSQSELLKAVSAQQADYMLIAPEEIDMLIRNAKLPPEDFTTLRLQDATEGNLRYLMCGKSVDDDFIEKMNLAIQRLFPELNAGNHIKASATQTADLP